MNNKDLKELELAYKQTFGSETGEKVLEDLKKRCSFYSTTHVKNDSHESAFLEGTRSVILFINNMLNRKPTEEKINE